MKKLNISVSTLIPAENNIAVSDNYHSLELVRLAPVWQEGLKRFFMDLKCNGDDIFFSPHLIDDFSLAKISSCNGMDLYCILVENNNILGYGLLRGWDDGYVIPSLGLAIHPLARGAGLGKFFMDFLHFQAFRRGASKVRLRVNKKNERAIALYTSLGYLFEEDTKQVEFFVGFKSLGKE